MFTRLRIPCGMKYGARTLRRALQKDISDAISIELLNKRIVENDVIEVNLTDNRLTFIKLNGIDKSASAKKKKKLKVGVD